MAASAQQSIGVRHAGRVHFLPKTLLKTLAEGSMILSLGLLLGGCARSVVATTVDPNGTWTRKVTFHGVKPQKDGIIGTSIEEAFVLPQGAGWKITHQDVKDEAVIVAERGLSPGETLHGDITIKGGKKQTAPLAVNDVSVQKVAPGIYKYTETIHWKGAVPKELTPDADTVATFKKALPPSLATDVNARDLASQSVREIWRVMFGPGDPLISELSTIFTQPELMERRVQHRIGTNLEKRLEAKFGAQLTPTQRRTISYNIIHTSMFDLSSKTKNAGPGGNKPEQDNNGEPSASLFLAVKMPGHITETNGERDDINGDVFWTLYPEAAALGDVTLTATCDTNK